MNNNKQTPLFQWGDDGWQVNVTLIAERKSAPKKITINDVQALTKLPLHRLPRRKGEFIIWKSYRILRLAKDSWEIYPKMSL
ncbi:hypothetical protein PCC7424_1711 [Gloeothece citriformis PCC 7424]|uniref:Uncharacterized protein n=1 Tax=Gloeothece citriformis (strain PCC 7424) TaxID=65393 RepID=B7KB36_GLOC7|nr:hypothetical protein [Gloeothece citriformis]ACK70146.1 hypothetical protein PCC7424_1711 [Gloeothece citriformis PCC 7424]